MLCELPYIMHQRLYENILIMKNYVYGHNRELKIEDADVKDDVKMASKWRGISITAWAITPFSRHFHAIFTTDISLMNNKTKH